MGEDEFWTLMPRKAKNFSSEQAAKILGMDLDNLADFLCFVFATRAELLMNIARKGVLPGLSKQKAQVIRNIRTGIISAMKKVSSDRDSFAGTTDNVSITCMSSVSENSTSLSLDRTAQPRLISTVERGCTIHVVCRLKPLDESEKDAGKGPCFVFTSRKEIVAVPPTASRYSGDTKFMFDSVFGPTATQADVFDELVEFIRPVLEGRRLTIISYGASGSGKTYTLVGEEKGENQGLLPRSMHHVFAASETSADWDFSFKVACFEIFKNKCQDLLATSKERSKVELKITDSRTREARLCGAKYHRVECVETTMRCFRECLKRRAMNPTQANAQSSRSHFVFQLHTTAKNKTTRKQNCGILSIVDLAGKEDVKVSKASGDRMSEAQNINSSLTMLGNMVYDLANDCTHVKFRDSPLTKLLAGSFLANRNTDTIILVNASSEERSFQLTADALAFAKTVKRIKSKRL